MKTVAILSNEHSWTYNLRKEIIQGLLDEGYEVVLVLPYGEKVELLKKMGCSFVDVPMFKRRGKNPITELRLLMYYNKVLKMIRPDVVLTYTIKPNLYGGFVCEVLHIPFIANITGLGTTVNAGCIQKIFILTLYKIGLKGAHRVFFQNEDNKNYLVNRKMVTSSYSVLPGSGVNLTKHCYEQYPDEDNGIIISYIGRVMQDKGIDELLQASESIKKNHPEVTFRIIGFFDDDYEQTIDSAVSKEIIEYIPQQTDIHPWIAESHAVIIPSHHEGMNNVILEAASTGRPVLCSNIPGCREAIDDGVSGLLFQVGNVTSVQRCIERFLQMSHNQKVDMGKAGREKMKKQFNRNIVVDRYIKEIKIAERI